jgi:hypothetical protein
MFSNPYLKINVPAHHDTKKNVSGFLTNPVEPSYATTSLHHSTTWTASVPSFALPKSMTTPFHRYKIIGLPNPVLLLSIFYHIKIVPPHIR